MMKRLVALTVTALMLFVLIGCQSAAKSACPTTCDKDPATCQYCPQAKKLVGYEGTVHCDKCNKDMPAGQWCAKCNRFMLSGTVHCDKCGKDMPKGLYCACCKKYVGVPEMAYCEGCKAPYVKAKGCPTCKKGCEKTCTK